MYVLEYLTVNKLKGFIPNFDSKKVLKSAL